MIAREARIVGLRSFSTPSLDDVDRRRMQLWVVTATLLIAISAIVVLVSIFPGEASQRLQGQFGVRVAGIGLIIGFTAYGFEKETHLRRLTRLLIDERVLSAALTNRVREISTLLDAGRAVNSAYDLEHVLDIILGGTLDLLGGGSGSILLVDDEGELRPACTRGRSGEPEGGIAEPLEQLAARVASAGEPVLVEAGRGTAERAMTVPLIDRDQMLGVLHIDAAPGRTFSEYDLRAVGLFAEQAASAIGKARLYDAAQRQSGQLAHLAFHDPLTGLANRSLFAQRSRQAISRAQRQGRVAALLFIDLDDFKHVNDSLGHAAGDVLLTAVADRLGQTVRAEDTAARLGGDEFGLLIEDARGDDDAAAVADRVLASLRAPFVTEGREVFVSASIGIARVGQHGDTFEELLRSADLAMYEAKRRGKGAFHFFEEPMFTAAVDRMQREGDLQRAVERGELALHYQPSVDLQTGEIAGVEALLRWYHPERGILLPSEFIPLAVDNGLIVPIGTWVIREACHQLHRWRVELGAAAPGWVAVNLSARQLGDALVEDVRDALAAHGLPGASLVLEVTEDALVHEMEHSVGVLQALRNTGVRVAIDDFGTGYSSLSYLVRLPVDTLKVDKSFVDGLALGPQAPAVVAAMMELARQLGLSTIAEGVEDAQQCAVLRDLGCEQAQGFLFSRAVPAEELSRVLATAALTQPQRA